MSKEPVLDVQDEQVRLHFYLGEFQQAISAAQKSHSNNVHKDVYLYRAYIALKKWVQLGFWSITFQRLTLLFFV